MKNDKLELWKTRIAECKRSGLPVSKWCEQNNLYRSEYNYWQNKIEQEKSVSSPAVIADVTSILRSDDKNVSNTTVNTTIELKYNDVSINISNGREAKLAAMFIGHLQNYVK